ncbi:MAG: 5-methyltetrahydropteroyltriglutamate--homocysteine S-methyltransferase [Chitinophagaceae bacterium]|nr:MAG: 5-methyltetrahydropteroyltriglutamate--homocysteine S-methyltransferase [Chitinophagaceae bacterium]
MITHNLGYPRIGNNRELKKALEGYWSGKISLDELRVTGINIRKQNWLLQKNTAIDLIPSNDFSLYDQVLDMSLAVKAIPDRYNTMLKNNDYAEEDLSFAMARGYQKNGLDITAMEMTKWFDTNYHYIVPEFHKDQHFEFYSQKVIREFNEAKQLGIITRPVLIGPVSYLLLGKEKGEGFDKLDLLPGLLSVYIEILKALQAAGAYGVQLDEPFLAMDLSDKAKKSFEPAYTKLKEAIPGMKVMIATYFEGLRDNAPLALSLPVSALHIDLVRDPQQLDDLLEKIPASLSLSLGVVDGRNIWINNFEQSLAYIHKAADKLGDERIMIAPSCSLLHVPCDLDLETDNTLNSGTRQWLAFAKQKLEETVVLKKLALQKNVQDVDKKLKENILAVKNRKTSAIIHDKKVKERVANIKEGDTHRKCAFAVRRRVQHETLNLPLFPTTTIGSFPQTKEVRSWRLQLKKGTISPEQYNNLIKKEIERTIRWQEDIGMDVLVHGEFERNDMVEYFGEQLAGITFTKNGWVQSYGSRCVKPPIIYGDVYRPAPMTVEWISFTQSLTNKIVKGMLTGPVTMLEWSFVRNDQPRADTCIQIALAIRDEVLDLEKAGIKIIQIDEPAIREGLPLRKADWKNYLNWAVRAFKVTSGGVKDETQIHTHICYSEFNDIIDSIAAMDADVITIECSRSQMELLDAFVNFKYPNEIGPGVYDIHSPRVPAKSEMIFLLNKAKSVIPKEQIWVNPDCGLKTRKWEETEKALVEMVEAAKEMRNDSRA